MTSSLSEDEFHRMQLQLIELRTSNYELEAKEKKQRVEIDSLLEKLRLNDRDLQIANKTIQKSKKAKEVEILIRENEVLQRKLESQEEEFRLQNQTLMQELTKLDSDNEELQKRLSEAENPNSELNASVLSETDDEIRHLKAENSVLHKKILELNDKIDKLPKSPNEKSLKFEDVEETEKSEDTPDSILESHEGEENSVQEQNLSEILQKTKMLLETKVEENSLLRTQFAETENTLKSKLSELQQEIDQCHEKFTRKQESYLQLQKEKEALFKTNKDQATELKEVRERDSKYYNDQIAKLQQEIESLKSEKESSNMNANTEVVELQNQLAELKKQLNAANIVEKQHIDEIVSKHNADMAEIQKQVSNLTKSKESLSKQVEVSKKKEEELVQQVQNLKKDLEVKCTEAKEAQKVAEKRKAMLDDLANTYQRDSAANQEKLRSQEEQFEKEILGLKERVKSESIRSSEFEKLKTQLDEMTKQYKSAEEARGWLERRLQESEANLENVKEDNQKMLESLRNEHESEMEVIKETHSKEINDLAQKHDVELSSCEEKENTLKEKISALEQEVESLKQAIKDSVDERKIHEKKGLATVKDIKRQLHQERKRAEKLQNKLQEILSDSKHSKGLDDLSSAYDGNESVDRSSISSWSGGASLVREFSGLSGTSSVPSPDKEFALSPTRESVTMMDEEHTDLLHKVAELQLHNSNLTEKVHHLETSNAAMAEDLLQKSKIIEHFVMEGRNDKVPASHQHEDKLTFKKVLDFVNKNEENNYYKEMNRKLQRMLEESLTKNMHLQNDLQLLSDELMKQSKGQGSSDESSKGQSDKDKGIVANTGADTAISDNLRIGDGEKS